MEPKLLLWEKNEGIGLLTMNRPEKYNALNRPLLLDMLKIVQEAATDDEVRVLVITGAGKAFCSGGDITGHPSFETDDMFVREKFVAEGGTLTLNINRLPKPVIAAVNGIATGAGMDMALACDIRIASDRAKFSESFSRAGMMPDMGGSWLLPRIIGLGRALEMIYTGDTIDANEAYRIGLVNHLAPHDELMKKTMEMAARFAKGPAQSYRLSKWAVYKAQNVDLQSAMEHERMGQNLLLGSQDSKIAVTAFSEKKTPVFKGK
jgi:2-(1,2-epoxy-1,2-dihydrophenyl)acetyl-CoA isomerase